MNPAPSGPRDLVAETLARHETSTVHDVPTADDPLAEALHYLRMDGIFYCRSELTAPWGVDLPPMDDCLWFHVVTRGRCLLTTAAGEEVHLGAGDVAVLPHGAGHSAVDAPGAEAPLVFDLPHQYVSRQYAILRHGGGGERADIICGVARLGHPVARSLIAMLPEVIHIDAAHERQDWQWLPGVLSLIGSELAATKPGGETIVTRLCDVLVIHAIRAWIDSDPAARTGWLGALRDPLIGLAISRIHGDPANDWTVASLAAEVGMSRSAFAARFTDLVGQSPKQYVTSWRMRLAEDILQREPVSILELATRLGYGSEAAFSRAFKREIGCAPSSIRTRGDLVEMAQHIAGDTPG